MAAFDFPNTPFPGQEYSANGVTYVWNGFGWAGEPLADFVDVSGDTMTGALTIKKSPGVDGHLTLDSPSPLDVVAISFRKNGFMRWRTGVSPGPEPGANAGSSYAIQRYTDAGVLIDNPLLISRQTGRPSLTQQPVDPNDIATKAYVDSMTGGGPGYLPLTGGTLSGPLTAPMYVVNAQAGQTADQYSQSQGIARWLVRTVDTGASDYQIHRYADSGAYLGMPFTIERATGNATFAGNVTVNGALSATSGTITTLNTITATINNCNSGGTFNLTTLTSNSLTTNAITDYGTLTVNGTSYLQGIQGASLGVTGNVNCSFVYAANGVVAKDLFAQDTGGVSIYTNGAIQFNAAPDGPAQYVVGLNSNRLLFMNTAVPPGVNIHSWLDAAGCFACTGFISRNGTAGSSGGNVWNYFWAGNALQVYVDTVYVGNMVISCDHRIKRNVVPLPSMWDKVKSLNPVSFNLADYAPTGTKADDEEHWGFVAHELQETLTMDAASGVKDAPDTLQAPNLLAVVAALTVALQEAMARIETLEYKLGQN